MCVCVSVCAMWRVVVKFLGVRSGQVILFTPPGNSATKPAVEVGMLLTLWRGVKSPKPVTSSLSVNSCVAFRVVQLELAQEERFWSGAHCSKFM